MPPYLPCGPDRDDNAKHHLGSKNTRNSATRQRLYSLLKTCRYDALRDELVAAELAQEISEFHALNLHAILAMIDGPEFASDYLEMAEAVAASPHERAVLAETLAAYDLLRGNPGAAAERCLAALDHICQTEGLWNSLLIALYRLGDVESLDATLRSFARLLDDECTARLVKWLSDNPDLREIHTRPAFIELLNRHAAI